MSTAGPDTIVLIHGFWVTPRSWEHWIAHYEAKGFRVVAPAYPGFEVEVEALNADPSPIEALTVPAIVAHLETVVGALEIAADPDGALRGRRVHADPARSRLRGRGRGDQLGARPRASSACRCRRSRRRFPVLKNPANRHRAVGFTHEQWHYAFTNGFSEEESRALYERYHVPASGAIFWGSALANIHPGQRRQLGRLRQRRPRAAAVHLRQRRPPDAAVAPALQRQALQVRHDHRGQGVRGPAPAPRLGGLGGGRRLRARLGAQPRREGAPSSAA